MQGHSDAVFFKSTLPVIITMSWEISTWEQMLKRLLSNYLWHTLLLQRCIQMYMPRWHAQINTHTHTHTRGRSVIAQEVFRGNNSLRVSLHPILGASEGGKRIDQTADSGVLIQSSYLLQDCCETYCLYLSVFLALSLAEEESIKRKFTIYTLHHIL